MTEKERRCQQALKRRIQGIQDANDDADVAESYEDHMYRQLCEEMERGKRMVTGDIAGLRVWALQAERSLAARAVGLQPWVLAIGVVRGLRGLRARLRYAAAFDARWRDAVSIPKPKRKTRHRS